MYWRVLGYGFDAKAPAHIVAIRPLRDGVSTDFDTTKKMLRYFFQKVHQRRSLVRPRLVVTVPTGITGVEQRAVEDASVQAGARAVFIIGSSPRSVDSDKATAPSRYP